MRLRRSYCTGRCTERPIYYVYCPHNYLPDIFISYLEAVQGLLLSPVPSLVAVTRN